MLIAVYRRARELIDPLECTWAVSCSLGQERINTKVVVTKLSG